MLTTKDVNNCSILSFASAGISFIVGVVADVGDVILCMGECFLTRI
jgi:hypothetical protein